MKSLLLGAVRAAIAVSLLVWLSRSGVLEFSALLRLLTAWPLTLAALALLAADMAVTAWRLCVLVKPMGFDLTLWSSLRLSLIGVFFSSFLPGGGGGDLVRIYYALHGNRGQRTELGTVMLLDRAAGLVALLLWPLLAAAWFRGLLATHAVLQSLLWGAALFFATLVAGAMAGFSPMVVKHALVRSLLRRMPLGAYLERALATVHAYRNHAGSLLAAVGISLAAHTMSIGVMLLVARAMHPASFDWSMSLLIPLGALANALPVTPGGIGVGEAAMNSLFQIAGLSGGADILLGWRLLMLCLGLSGLVFYLQGSRRLVHAAPGQQGEATP